jgi:ATP-dependent DNA ligase
MHWSAPRRPGLTPAGFIEPSIPTQVDKPPTGPDWIHEIKHDGYRIIGRKHDGRVRLSSRIVFPHAGQTGEYRGRGMRPGS